MPDEVGGSFTNRNITKIYNVCNASDLGRVGIFEIEQFEAGVGDGDRRRTNDTVDGRARRLQEVGEPVLHVSLDETTRIFNNVIKFSCRFRFTIEKSKQSLEKGRHTVARTGVFNCTDSPS